MIKNKWILTFGLRPEEVALIRRESGALVTVASSPKLFSTTLKFSKRQPDLIICSASPYFFSTLFTVRKRIILLRAFLVNPSRPLSEADVRELLPKNGIPVKRQVK